MKTTTSVKSSSRLLSYASLAISSTALISTDADAATVVNVNAATYNTGFSDLGTVKFDAGIGTSKSYIAFSGVGASVPNPSVFARGSSTAPVLFSGTSSAFQYMNGTSASNGALLASNDNWFYAVGSTDNTQRVWLQLYFGNGGGSQFSIVKAVVPDTVDELPTAASASAVPEPSAMALLSLGAAGLLAKRRRSA